MKRTLSLALTALCAAPAAWGTEEAMNAALSQWQQRMAEYEAAVQRAETPEARATVALPDGYDIAPALWQSINAKTGSRIEETKLRKGSKKQVVDTYEFEQAWAAPAVVWMLNHPQAFAAVFGGKTKRVSFFADALLSSMNNTHFSHPSAAELCPTLANGGGMREYEILQKIYNRNNDKNTRACAALAMSLLLNNSEMMAGVEGSESMARAKRVYYLKQALLLADEQTQFGPAALNEVAETQVYYLKNLAVGARPPHLQLKDLQNRDITFPEAGKVSLLLFWSPDEPTGAAMAANAAKLEQQYPGLNVVPVMPAADEEQRSHPEESGVNTAVDDADGSAGKAYRITAVPTAVLVGKQGTVLYYGAPNIQLQAALNAALKSEKAAAAAAKPRVIIQETVPQAPAAPPAASPAPQPAPAEDEAAPGLRTMPKF